VEGLDVLDPGEGHMVIGPAAGAGDRHFVGLGPVEDPVAQGRQTLDDVERMLVPVRVVEVDVEKRHDDPKGRPGIDPDRRDGDARRVREHSENLIRPA
jgi:hypothetical protein